MIRLTTSGGDKKDQPTTGVAASRVLLRVENLDKSFGGQRVVADVGLELREGEVVILRGPNGCGKTTLLNILTGNLEPDAGTISLSPGAATEVFKFPFSWWQTLNPFNHFTPERVARLGVGRTWQEIRLFQSLSLRENIAAASSHQPGEAPVRALLRPSLVRRQDKKVLGDADRMLFRLGLHSRERSSADKVSLGQAKRTAIARAVFAGAKILFLDEPLAGLDAAGVEGIMGMLEGLANQHKVTLVIVEHALNIPLMLDLATTVWTLDGGRLTAEHPDKVRQELGLGNIRAAFFQPNQLPLRGPKSKRVPLAGGAAVNTWNSTGDGEMLLEVENLVVRRGARTVFGGEDDGAEAAFGLSFTLRRGDTAVLQAPNGWGKTTLMEALAGLIPIVGGVIKLKGEPIQHLPTWERRRRGLSLLQARSNSFPNLTVREALKVARVKAIPDALRPMLGRQVSDLSGGEKQRLALACALQGSEFVVGLLDEPLNALDQNSVGDLLASLPRYGKHAGLLIAVPAAAEGAEKEEGDVGLYAHTIHR
jgi:ABC-type branched-subunit amino acid transport system ATPase component